jgi:acyl-CoA thioesterase I
LVLALSLAAGACSGETDSSDTPAPPRPEGRPPLYVAIGASETYGVGAEDPLRDSWPHVFFKTALPPSTSFVNLGIPGATVEDALDRELPYAVKLDPEIVTVWLNVNDMIAGFTPQDYERNLSRLLKELSDKGVEQILVANTPPLDHLPAYRNCRRPAAAESVECSFALRRRLPTREALNDMVADYNRAVARAATRTGAVVVDLHRRALELREAGREEELISDDGFHPSSAGHKAVAEAFARALNR